MSKILIVSPVPSHPQDAGNRSRIFALLSELKKNGHNIFFFHIKMECGDEFAMKSEWDEFVSIPYKRKANPPPKKIYDWLARRLNSNWVLPFKIDDWYTSNISISLKNIRDRFKPDVLIVEYVFFSKVFECFGEEVLKILDTLDRFVSRHRIFMDNNLLPLWFYTTIKEEKRYQTC